MPRDIGFRVWWHGKMYAPNYLHFSPEGELFGVLINEGVFCAIHEVHLMQFTGLFDCHKIGIYESDIVKVEDSALGVIEYSGAGFMINIGKNRISLNDLVPEYIEIVGNIYQGTGSLPELLPEFQKEINRHA